VKATNLSGAIALVLSVASFSATAEWVKVVQTSTATFYVDNDNVIRTDSKVKVWHLIDLAAISPAPEASKAHLSSIRQSEYDCALQKYRNGFLADYAGPMGSDVPIRTNIGSLAWAPIAPGSVDAMLSAFVCSKL
jgi:hypothetical protein